MRSGCTEAARKESVANSFPSGDQTLFILTPAGGAYVPTVFVGMYAPLSLSMPSQHFIHAQDRRVIPEIEPPTRPRPVARVLQQASFDGIVVHVIQFSSDTRALCRPWGAYIPTKTVGTYAPPGFAPPCGLVRGGAIMGTSPRKAMTTLAPWRDRWREGKRDGGAWTFCLLTGDRSYDSLFI